MLQAEHGKLDYLIFECLAERTVTRENPSRSNNPDGGYRPRMRKRPGTVLPVCLSNGTSLATNMCATSPKGAARVLQTYANDKGLGALSCAIVLGDALSDIVGQRLN